MADQDTSPAELQNFGVSLALGAQLAFAGQLLSALIANDCLSREQASELLTKVSEMIRSSMDTPTTDLQAVTKKPLQDHAEALTKLASDFSSSLEKS